MDHSTFLHLTALVAARFTNRSLPFIGVHRRSSSLAILPLLVAACGSRDDPPKRNRFSITITRPAIGIQLVDKSPARDALELL